MEDMILEQAEQVDGYALYKRFLRRYVESYKQYVKLTDDEIDKITKRVLMNDFVYENLEQEVCDILEGMGKFKGMV